MRGGDSIRRGRGVTRPAPAPGGGEREGLEPARGGEGGEGSARAPGGLDPARGGLDPARMGGGARSGKGGSQKMRIYMHRCVLGAAPRARARAPAAGRRTLIRGPRPGAFGPATPCRIGTARGVY